MISIIEWENFEAQKNNISCIDRPQFERITADKFEHGSGQQCSRNACSLFLSDVIT